MYKREGFNKSSKWNEMVAFRPSRAASITRAGFYNQVRKFQPPPEYFKYPADSTGVNFVSFALRMYQGPSDGNPLLISRRTERSR
jgi:hypothetical protein